MATHALIQGTLTIRHGSDRLRLSADGQRVDLHASSLSILRDAGRITRLVREVVQNVRPVEPGADDDADNSSTGDRPARARGSSIGLAAERVRQQGLTMRIFIGERLIAEVGPEIEPNFAARLLRLAPMRLHAVEVVRGWLG